jgi:8-oxo-dGTP pyrophosphatase MutT (NUDIX family)
MLLLSNFERYLKARRAKTQRFRRFMVRSSVAVILREQVGVLEVLLIKRADKKDDRWSGHMAFPGGRSQKEDLSAKATAIRETQEEVGLTLNAKNYIGRLSDIMTLAHGSKRPMVVSPYVFKIKTEPKFVLNHEVAEVVWVPLSFLANPINRDTMPWKQKGIKLQLPCYFYKGYRIWGLTLRMLDELVSGVFMKLK